MNREATEALGNGKAAGSPGAAAPPAAIATAAIVCEGGGGRRRTPGGVALAASGSYDDSDDFAPFGKCTILAYGYWMQAQSSYTRGHTDQPH